MHCVHCGAQLIPGQIFCSQCGQAVAVANQPSAAAPYAHAQAPAGITITPTRAAINRVARNLNTLAILWIAYSILRLVPGVALMAFSHLRLPFLFMPFPGMHTRLGPFLGFIGFGVSALAIAGVIAGWGLIERRQWARVLAIVLAILALIHIPLGTALGIYTLWVLGPQESCREYESLARV